ncbi:hypothetical protein [Candidatus Poriferisocius sp.]|uniref:hypothetical protein n=1 Tax=Candidatus Poriferisocius sp. TaxID=3101276 RepID=UPI003B522F11
MLFRTPDLPPANYEACPADFGQLVANATALAEGSENFQQRPGWAAESFIPCLCCAGKGCECCDDEGGHLQDIQDPRSVREGCFSCGSTGLKLSTDPETGKSPKCSLCNGHGYHMTVRATGQGAFGPKSTLSEGEKVRNAVDYAIETEGFVVLGRIAEDVGVENSVVARICKAKGLVNRKILRGGSRFRAWTPK